MHRMNLAPLYRATVGFDQIADLMDRALASAASETNYPPYNIERLADGGWRISIAVAGFSGDELSAEVRENSLIVTARKVEDTTNPETARTFLHRGIANRAFERRFHLADHVRVTAASHVDGMLHIDLVREVPEALKPRRIEIASSKAQDANLVEAKAVN